MRGRSDRERLGIMEPGQDLVIAGYAGQEGASRIIREKRKELLEHFSAAFLEIQEDIRLSSSLEDWKRFGVTECEPAGEGGILNALWNLSGAYDVGIGFWLRRIPVRQQTVEICEYYDLNPYRLLSGSCMLLVCGNGSQAVRHMRQEGIPAEVIGVVNRGIKREIFNGEGQGFLERPQRDEIYKVL